MSTLVSINGDSWTPITPAGAVRTTWIKTKPAKGQIVIAHSQDGAGSLDISDGYFLIASRRKINNLIPDGSLDIYYARCSAENCTAELIIDITYGFPVPLETNGAVPVNIQDQTTEIIDLHLSLFESTLTIDQDMSLKDTQVLATVDPAFDPNPPASGGRIICFKEGTAFFQAGILSAVNQGGDQWLIDLDSPTDFPFTTAGGCSVRTINMAVDGSVTPVEFEISPDRLDANLKWDIVRVIMTFVGPGFGTPPDNQPDDTTFGAAGPALTKGLVWRKENGNHKNIFNAKTNADFRVRMYDVSYQDANKNGDFGVSIRRTFGGQDKNGVVIRLENDIDPDNADKFIMIIQDDLTDHVFIQAVVQGHVILD